MSISNLEYFVRRVDELASENARLKAEVERLKGVIFAQSSDFVRSKTGNADISKHPIMGPAWEEWQRTRKAKEGKQS